MKTVKKLVSLTVMLFLVAAPIVRAFAAAPIPSSETRISAPHDAVSLQLVPRLRRPKQAYLVVAPSSSPRIPPAVSPRGSVIVPDLQGFLPTYAGLPDHPPA